VQVGRAVDQLVRPGQMAKGLMGKASFKSIGSKMCPQFFFSRPLLPTPVFPFQC
jgi:hypothetical protein